MQAATLVFLFLVCGESQADELNVKKEDQSWYTLEADNVTEIIKRISTGYDKILRPYHKVKPLKISVSLGLTSISHISEENMEFQANIYLRQHWHDPRLAYGKDNTSIILQGEMLDKLWLPDSYIDNARKTVVDKSTKTVILSANGSIFYTFRATYHVSSQMNFLYYPMDKQTLELKIFSYAYDSNKILLEWKGGVLLNKELATFVTEDVSLLEEKYKYITGVFSTLTFRFKVRRRLGYFMMQFYFPCILCAVVSWLPFWMDRYEIGDRVSLGITTLLTEMFLSQYINSAMPRVNYIKAADEFLLASFLFILLALIESVVVYNVREDIRKKKRQITAGRGDNRQEPSVVGNGVINITDIFLDGIKSTEVQPEARKHSEQQPKVLQTRRNDLGCCVDKFSRIIFPTTYIAFVAYYFGRYVLLNNLT